MFQEEKEDDYGPKVQKRIQKLVGQRREAEIQAREIQEQNAQLQKRLERLEQGSQKSAEQAFNDRYSQTKAALHKAVEEGDTEAQVTFQEQMADMRAAMRIAEMQKQQTASCCISNSRPCAASCTKPSTTKAMQWWQQITGSMPQALSEKQRLRVQLMSNSTWRVMTKIQTNIIKFKQPFTKNVS